MTLLLVLILLNIFSSRNYNKICRFKSVSQTDKQTYILLLICKKKKKKDNFNDKKAHSANSVLFVLRKNENEKKIRYLHSEKIFK